VTARAVDRGMAVESDRDAQRKLGYPTQPTQILLRNGRPILL